MEAGSTHFKGGMIHFQGNPLVHVGDAMGLMVSVLDSCLSGLGSSPG